MKASIKNSRHAPRKIRLVADFLKGKSVTRALEVISLSPKRASHSVEKLLKSAVANAKNLGVSPDDLKIKECRVDKGIVFKRFNPVARGGANRINKRTSNIEIVLETKKSDSKLKTKDSK